MSENYSIKLLNLHVLNLVSKILTTIVSKATRKHKHFSLVNENIKKQSN